MAGGESKGDKDAILRQLNEAFTEAVVPHNAALGLQAVDCGRDWATLELPYDPKLVGNPRTGVLAGGAVTALMDATCGVSIFMKLKGPRRIATIDLRIDYLKPATPHHPVRARCQCYKTTTHIAFVRGVAFHDDESDPIASTAGTFMIFDEARSPLASRVYEEESESPDAREGGGQGTDV